jgi:hypothetical protein
MTSRVEQGLTSIGSGLERMTTGLLDGIGRTFEHATDALSLIAIPVADGVVSIVAARALAQSLDFPMWLAVGAGFAMEGAGVLVAKVPIEQHRFNQDNDGADAKAPEALGWVMFAVQTVFSTGLIVLSAMGPGVRLFGLGWLTLPVFGMMTLSVQSLAATVSAVLNADIKQREYSRTRRLDSEHRERERAKAERRAARQTAKSAPVRNEPERTERQAAIVRYAMEHRDASLDQIAEAVGTSKTTVHKETVAVGMKKNGHGWEALA